MTSRRILAAVLVSAGVAFVSGCEASRVDPKAKVTLSGTVATSSGAAASGIGISLLKRPDVGEVLGGLTIGLASVGLACTLEPPPAICRSARRTVSDGNGGFNYTLRGSDTRGSVGNADTLSVTATTPGKGGAVTTAAFKVQQERVVLPTMRLWDARLAFDPGELTPRWRSVPSDATLGGARDVTIQFSQANGVPVWEQPHARSGAPFDARALEDADVRARVRTDTSVNRQSGSYDLQYLSAEAHLVGAAGTPDSRGAACITPRPKGVQGLTGTPCWLTDGDLGGRAPGGQPRHSTVVIDLGSQRPISLITVRGEPVDRRISVSSDGRHFRLLSTRHGGFEQFEPNTRARYVRLQTPGGIEGTRELSVWE